LESIILSFSGFFSLGSIILVLLLLITNKSVKEALAFVGGYIFSYSMIGIVYIYASTKIIKIDSLISSQILIIVGLILVFIGLRNTFKKNKNTDEEAKIFVFIRKLNPKKAFIFGSLITIINIKNLAIFIAIASAVNNIDSCFMSKILLVIFDIFIFCLAMIILIGIRVLLRDLAEKVLVKLKVTIDKNSHYIAIFFPIIFGLYLIFKAF
jgi:threonine/homoserine/homoserine lactone efflux protein